jgi:hypothetical protein
MGGADLRISPHDGVVGVFSSTNVACGSMGSPPPARATSLDLASRTLRSVGPYPRSRVLTGRLRDRRYRSSLSPKRSVRMTAGDPDAQELPL